MVVARSLLESYVKEFEKTIESTRRKLDGSIGLSPVGEEIFIDRFEIKIPEEIQQDRDLWVQLQQQVVHMQKLMCRTSVFIDSYGMQVWRSAQKVRTRRHIPRRLYKYATLVKCYGNQICLYGIEGQGCALAQVASTPKSQADVEKRRVELEQVRVELEEWRARVQQAKAKLEHAENGDTTTNTTAATTTSIVLPKLPQMTLPVPHEEILDDGLIMIRKYQLIKMDADIY